MTCLLLLSKAIYLGLGSPVWICLSCLAWELTLSSLAFILISSQRYLAVGGFPVHGFTLCMGYQVLWPLQRSQSLGTPSSRGVWHEVYTSLHPG